MSTSNLCSTLGDFRVIWPCCPTRHIHSLSIFNGKCMQTFDRNMNLSSISILIETIDLHLFFKGLRPHPTTKSEDDETPSREKPKLSFQFVLEEARKALKPLGVTIDEREGQKILLKVRLKDNLSLSLSLIFYSMKIEHRGVCGQSLTVRPA